MADDDLKSFLREQAKSLDSLLELTPARNMFGEDVSDQWKRKKQTPEQKKAARMAKLDPANWKSAKDVYDERSREAAKKRKRDQVNEPSPSNGIDIPITSPGAPPMSKKQKVAMSAKPTIVGRVGDLETPEEIMNKNLKKKMKKRANRSEKNQEFRERKEQRKTEKAAQRAEGLESKVQESQSKQSQTSRKSKPTKERTTRDDGVQPTLKTKSPKQTNSVENIRRTDANKKKREADEHLDKNGSGDDGEWSDVEEETIDSTNQAVAEQDVEEEQDEIMEDATSTASSSEDIPDILSPPQDSAASSVSSIIPPPAVQSTKSPGDNKSPNLGRNLSSKSVQSEADRSAARQRLQEQISQFRSQRKADDKPVRSRAELLEQRRRSEAEKKAAKKEQRKKQREEEAILQDEEMTRRFSPGGSGSLLASPRSPIVDLGANEPFTFGRIAFEDGTQLDPTTLSAVASKKHKGASDPASALKAAQAKNARIAGLDQHKQHDIEEKDMWLNARKRAHGERVKDDTSLLKKALKRQEKQKLKSGKDWNERIEGVRASQDAKQKKRTENLQKRKDEKSAKKSGKKIKRPGFEGSFRGRTSKGKKK